MAKELRSYAGLDGSNHSYMFPRAKSFLRKHLLATFVGICFANAIVVLISGCSSREESEKSVSVEPVAEAKVYPKHDDWNKAETCRECHAEQYDDWMGSHHQLAHRRIDPTRDAEAFSGVKTTDEAGRAFDLLADGNTFGISETGAGLPSEVSAVIGETPIQQFLVPFEGGRFQIQEMTWDTHKKEWFNVFGNEVRDTGDWGHWSQQGMNWNSNCAWCHMTDYKKNYNLETNEYASTWEIEAISCTQCHSDMEHHVAAARAGDYKERTEIPNIQLAMDNCASCHARREELTDSGFHAGEKFDEHFRLVLPDLPNAYFVDGKANEEDYVFASFKLSRMGHKGVSCLDCHNPHSHETILPVEDNSLCLRCHSTGLNEAKIIDPITHSNHQADSAGNQCVTCHMPQRDYMQRDPRHDHGFTIPDPQLTIDYDVPNACATCHADQSPEWARDAIDEWYPESERRDALRDRAGTLHAYYNGDGNAWTDVHRLLQTEENTYWRSTYLRILGAMAPGTPESLDAALAGIKSESPVERESAMRILGNRNDRLADVQKGLNDPSLLVRNQSADTLSSMFNPNQKAYKEWKTYAEVNSDRPAGALRRAELAIQEGDLYLARQLAEQAASFDKNNAHLLYDIAIMFARIGDVNGALYKIEKAKQLDDSIALLWFGEGLLHAENGDVMKSIEAMEQAVARDESEDRWWYNLGVAYMQTNQAEKAQNALIQAVQLNQTEMQYQQVLGQLMQQQQQQQQ